MNKKKVIKYSSIGLCSALLLGSVTAYVYPAYSSNAKQVIEAVDTNKELKDVMIKELNVKTNTKNSKNELVYVFTDASGKQDHILVSDQLNSTQEKINDVSTLDNIENMSGDETYTVNNNNIVWKNNGKNITYQGTTNKQAPITMKVTYYLNNKEIAPEELAGKSGKVKIRYDYTNNIQTTVNVDGKNYTVHVPLTMMTGLVLDDHFSNIKVTNGKTVQLSDSIAVLGLTMPGVKDSLDVDIDIPEYFEVEANVEDFALNETMSLATSNLLSDINVDELSLDTLQDKMKQLQDASNQLVQGTSDLHEGTETLYSKVPVLQQGMNTLYEATTSLVDASGKLSAGSNSLNDKMSLFSSKLSELYATLQNKQLDQNVSKLSQGANQINEGINGEAGLLQAMNANMNQAQTIYNQTYKDSYNYLVGCLVKQQAMSNNVDPSQIQNNPNAMQAITSSLQAQGITSEANIASTLQDAQNNQLTALSAGLMKAYASLSGMDSNGQILKDMTSKIVMMNQANATYKTLYQSSSTLKQSGLDAGVKALNEGLNQLNQSVGSFDNYQEGTLCSSLYSLKEASNQLVQEGSTPLSDNLKTLASKSKELNQGTATLNDASKQLEAGVKALNEGALTLNQGMATFNETGIQSLAKLAGDDATKAMNTLKAIIKAGQNYQTFSGKSDQMEGTVQFIYQTQPIQSNKK